CGTLSSALAADRANEPPAFYGFTSDGKLAARLETKIREFAKRLVVVVADVGWRNLVGRDVVTKRSGRRPREILPGQLTANQFGVIDEEENSTGETHPVRTSLDQPGPEALDHSAPETCRLLPSEARRSLH